MNIAILGATSHIAKGLIFRFLGKDEVHLDLYTRSSSRMMDFLNSIKKNSSKSYLIHQGYSDFLTNSHDVVINCVGVGTQNKLKGNYSLYFTVTEKYDNMVIDYLLKKNPDALYISFSSGAVYGRDFSEPATRNTINSLLVNDLKPTDYYAIARLNAETKHRALSHLNIVDLRLFSFFSRFIDLTDNYFMTELLNCVINKDTFHTNKQNMIRDFIHPQEIFILLKKCLEIPIINQAFDIRSRKPVDKWSIINYFQDQFGLKIKTDETDSCDSGTGSKENYYSNYKNTGEIGFRTISTSMETIQQETAIILNQNQFKREP